ncbi:MAG TPA: DUF2254 domain-containing protein [Acidimicrobiia bacterium]|nr:DUF2254 domain-containing protein [Acidimicrobiia bacterium]
MARRLKQLRDRISDSLFYIPLFGILLAIMLAVVTSWIDTTFRDAIDDVPLLIRTTVDSARAILTTSAAATITVAGIVISITVVAVQLASSQFSPRVVPTVFGTRFQQTVIGIVVGSFTYTLLVLSRIRIDPEPLTIGAYRSFSVTLALALALVSVLAIVAFIDRSIQVMQVGEIIRRTTDATLARVESYMPERGEPTELASEPSPMPEGESVTIASPSDGWVLEIQTERLLATLPDRAVARLDTTVGGFVAVGSPMLTVWPPTDSGDVPSDRLGGFFSIGERRRARTDATFGIRQLADVALRALSPGINDPTTANEVILNLMAILREVLARDLPPRVIHTESGGKLFLPQSWTRGDWVRHAFAEIRIASASQPAVARTLIEALGALRDHLESEELPDRVEPLRREARLVIEGLENGAGLLAADIEPIRAFAEGLGLVEPRSEG